MWQGCKTVLQSVVEGRGTSVLHKLELELDASVDPSHPTDDMGRKLKLFDLAYIG